MNVILLDSAPSDLSKANALPNNFSCRANKRGHRTSQTNSGTRNVPANFKCMVIILSVTNVRQFLKKCPSAIHSRNGKFVEVISAQYAKFLCCQKRDGSQYQAVISQLLHREFAIKLGLADCVFIMLNREIHHLAVSWFINCASITEKFGLADLSGDFHLVRNKDGCGTEKLATVITCMVCKLFSGADRCASTLERRGRRKKQKISTNGEKITLFCNNIDGLSIEKQLALT